METLVIKRTPMKIKKDVVRKKFDEIFCEGTVQRVSYFVKKDKQFYRMYFVKVKLNHLVNNFIHCIKNNGFARIYAKPTWKIDLALPKLEDWVEIKN